jgi:hypothetical protein
MPRGALSRGDIEGVEEVGVHALMFEGRLSLIMVNPLVACLANFSLTALSSSLAQPDQY